MTRPHLLMYCQHSLGLGHLIRSFAIAGALTEAFDVTLLNGGRMPSNATVPAGVNVVDLPPLGHDDAYELVSHDDTLTVETAKARRVEMILDTFRRLRPEILMIELYPFGRKKFAFELEPLLDAVGPRRPGRTTVVCSLRDILVNQRRDQARHDERAALITNAHFDAVLVHADPAFATLEESFRPATPLTVPVSYTGFVAPPAPEPAAADHGEVRGGHVLVSAGGGMVGEPLLRVAVEAAPLIRAGTGLTMKLVAGPFLPEAAWEWLRTRSGPGIEVVRSVPDLASEIARSAASVSQGGYNTTMDLLRARTPAVVVPFSEGNEDEQRRRAQRLATLGVLQVLDAHECTAEALTAKVVAAVEYPPASIDLDLDGAIGTVRATLALLGTAGADSGSGPSPSAEVPMTVTEPEAVAT